MNTFFTPIKAILFNLKSGKRITHTTLYLLGGLMALLAIQSWSYIENNNAPLPFDNATMALETVGAWNRLLPSQRATLQSGGTVSGFDLGVCDAMGDPITADIISSAAPGSQDPLNINARLPRRWGNTSFYLARENTGSAGVQYCFDFSTAISFSMDSREHAYFADNESIQVSANNSGAPVNLSASYFGNPAFPANGMSGNGTSNVTLNANSTEGGGLWWEINSSGQDVTQVCIQYYSNGGNTLVEPFRLLIDAVKCVADDPVVCNGADWISRWNKLGLTQRTDLLESNSVFGFNTGFCDESGDAITFIEIDANAAPHSGNFQKNAKEPRPYGRYSFDNGRDYVGMGGSQYCFTLDEARPIRLSSEEHRFFSGTEVVQINAYLGADPVILNGNYYGSAGSGPVSGGPNGLILNGFQYGSDTWWSIGSENRPVSQVCVEYYVTGGVPVGREPFALGICATRCVYDDPYACSLQGGPCPVFPNVDIEKTVVPINDFGLNACSNPGGDVQFPAFEVTLKMKNHAGTVKQLFLEEDLLAYFGSAYVDTLSAPQIVFSNSSGDPEINPYFDGRNYTDIFIPGSGFLSAGQEIWISFSVYLDPNAPGASSYLTNSVYGGGLANGTYIYQDLSGANGSGYGLPTSFQNLPAGYVAVAAQDLTLEANIPNSMNGIDDWLATNGGAEFSVPGCGNVTWSNDYDPANWVEGCGQLTGSIEVTFTGTDGCGHVFTTCATFSLEDTIGPVCTKPTDLVLDCGNPNALAILEDWLAYDGAFTDLSTPVTFEHDFTGLDSLSCNGVPVVVTWTATDACGNETYFDATLTVTDTTAPSFSGVPSDLDLDRCDSIPEPDSIIVSDGCDLDPSVEFEEAQTGDDCHFTITRTWTATDDCGNSSMFVQTINVSDDNPPVFTNVPADVTVECPDVPVVDTPDVEDCSPFEVEFSEIQIGGACPLPSQIIRTWVAIDECGNVDSVSQVINMTSPMNIGVITFIPATLDTIVAACEDNPAFDSVAVETTCPEGGLSLSFTDDVENNGDCSQPFSVTRTWIAHDSCGNMESIVQTILVGPDTLAPVFHQNNPLDITVDCGEDIQLPVAFDNCGATTLSYEDDNVTGSCDSGFVFTRLWTATDLCGNNSMFSQNVTTSPDTTAPVFVFVPYDQFFDCDDDIVFDDPIAFDACGDVTITWQDSIVGTGDCHQVDSVWFGFDIIRTWTATDDCGNSSTAISNAWVLPGFNNGNLIAFSYIPENQLVSCGDDIFIGQAVCHSACDGLQLTFEDFYDEDCTEGTVITRIWTAVDDCGNMIEATQIIKIEADQTAPTFEFVPTDGTFNCDGGTPVFGTPTIKDNCASGTAIDISYNDVWENGGGCNDFTITRTWTAIDPCGNESSASQTLTLVDDDAPVFESVPLDMTISCGEPVVFGQAAAADACSNAQLSFTDSSADLCGGSHSLTRTWTATDACGNESTASQTVTVQDDVAPVFEFVPDDKTISCGESVDFGIAEAADGCSSVDVSFIDETATTCGGGYIVTRTWVATDACGNISQTEQKVTVADTETPYFTTVVDDQFISCSEPVVFDNVEAVDDCSNLTITFSDQEEVFACETINTRTWTAMDACGNSNELSQSIHSMDDEAPVFNAMPSYLELTLSEFDLWLPPAGDADDCNEVVFDISTSTESNCDFITHIYTYIATDLCNNAASHTLEVLITDAAFGMTVAFPAEIDCGEAYQLAISPQNGIAPYSYTWQIISGNGWQITAMPGQPIAEVLTGDGPAQISVGITDGNGCSAVELMELECEGGVNAVTIAEIGSFELVPNPVRDLLTVRFASMVSGKALFDIVNVMGSKSSSVRQEITTGENQFLFDTSQLPAGTYFILMKMDSGIEAKKFVKIW